MRRGIIMGQVVVVRFNRLFGAVSSGARELEMLPPLGWDEQQARQCLGASTCWTCVGQWPSRGHCSPLTSLLKALRLPSAAAAAATPSRRAGRASVPRRGRAPNTPPSDGGDQRVDCVSGCGLRVERRPRATCNSRAAAATATTELAVRPTQSSDLRPTSLSV